MRIAVVIPAFNVAPWVGDAIESVRGQTHEDWSLVVVDDGSSDGTAELVGAFADKRVKLLAQDNAGVSIARNRGLAASDGEAVLFLDADDWLAADAVAAAAPFVFVPERARPGGCRGEVGRVRPAASGHLLPWLLERNPFANGGQVLIRRAPLERLGGFRPGLAYGEDWELWCRLALLGPFASAPGRSPDLFVRRRASGATLRMASDVNSFGPCMDAVFGNPDLLTRLGMETVVAYRRRSEAERSWIVGRELVRHGRAPEGRRWLRRSFAAKPSLKRLALLAAAQGLAMLPAPARGPFRAYEA